MHTVISFLVVFWGWAMGNLAYSPPLDIQAMTIGISANMALFITIVWLSIQRRVLP
jgi:hypothetical protein